MQIRTKTWYVLQNVALPHTTVKNRTTATTVRVVQPMTEALGGRRSQVTTWERPLTGELLLVNQRLRYVMYGGRVNRDSYREDAPYHSITIWDHTARLCHYFIRLWLCKVSWISCFTLWHRSENVDQIQPCLVSFVRWIHTHETSSQEGTVCRTRRGLLAVRESRGVMTGEVLMLVLIGRQSIQDDASTWQGWVTHGHYHAGRSAKHGLYHCLHVLSRSDASRNLFNPLTPTVAKWVQLKVSCARPG